MYPINTHQNPATGQYVPYFYQAGIFDRYGLMPVYLGRRDRKNDRSGLDHSGRFPALDHPQTVEQIIAHGYFSAPAGEPETVLLSDKKATSWLGLDDII